MASIRTWLPVSLFAVALGAVPARADNESPPEPVPVHDAPVWLAISVTPTFDLSAETGSQIILVDIGTFIASDSPEGTTFEPAALEGVAFPESVESLNALLGNAATVFGTIETRVEEGDGERHMFTPVPDPIPQEIQDAVHQASTYPVIDLEDSFVSLQELLQTNPFPTTLDVANAISTFLPIVNEAPSHTPGEVLEHVFATTETLQRSGDGPTLSVTSEGEMFPHDPDAPTLVFSLSLNGDGDLTSVFGEPISIDVKPESDTNPVNLKKKGSLPVALLSDEDFDAADVDTDTVTMGGVPSDHCDLEDVDGDGDDDLVCHFDVPSLVEAFLDVDVDEVFVVAELTDGTFVAGGDVVDTFEN